jgi:hypothetical protein
MGMGHARAGRAQMSRTFFDIVERFDDAPGHSLATQSSA